VCATAVSPQENQTIPAVFAQQPIPSPRYYRRKVCPYQRGVPAVTAMFPQSPLPCSRARNSAKGKTNSTSAIVGPDCNLRHESPTQSQHLISEVKTTEQKIHQKRKKTKEKKNKRLTLWSGCASNPQRTQQNNKLSTCPRCHHLHSHLDSVSSWHT